MKDSSLSLTHSLTPTLPLSLFIRSLPPLVSEWRIFVKHKWFTMFRKVVEQWKIWLEKFSNAAAVQFLLHSSSREYTSSTGRNDDDDDNDSCNFSVPLCILHFPIKSNKWITLNPNQPLHAYDFIYTCFFRTSHPISEFRKREAKMNFHYLIWVREEIRKTVD